MRVLIACEYSGIVRDAFLAKGHDAWSCDIIPTESPGPHFQEDVLGILGNGWDLMIAHPPCTYLSNAGAKHLYKGHKLNKERFEKGLEAKDFFLKLLNSSIPRIAIENPIPSKIFNLPKHSQCVQPYFFGDPFQKKTYLWLRGLLPLIYNEPEEKFQNTRQAGNWFNKGGRDRQKNRAKTFPGIAAAMAGQWGVS